ncbi:hypothetical protein P7C71_g2846, partial [Lecanoromycetidae sp. Uapishka_2]
MDNHPPPPPYTPYDSTPRVASVRSAGASAGQAPITRARTVSREKDNGQEAAPKPRPKPNPDLGNALYEAVSAGNKEMVQIMLQNGACPNTRPINHKPTLSVAVQRGDAEIVKMLLEQSEPKLEATPPGGHTALYGAVKEGNADMVRLLMQYGANVNAKPSGGSPPLCKAYSNGYKDMFRLLLESPYINVDATPSGDATTLWHAAKKVDRDTVKALLGKGANADAKPSGGTTALWHAAVRGDRETADLLLQHGAKVDAKPSSGQTALWEAVSKGNETMVKLLMFHGADMNAKSSGADTALARATKNGNSDLVRILLEYSK